MSLLRICLSVPAVLLACTVGSAGLGGCYDLSSSGPRPEDFAAAPPEHGAQADEKNEARPASPTALDTSDAVVRAIAAPASAEDEAIIPGGALRR